VRDVGGIFWWMIGVGSKFRRIVVAVNRERERRGGEKGENNVHSIRRYRSAFVYRNKQTDVGTHRVRYIIIYH